MISKSDIIEKLQSVLEPLEYVYAFWLEGADANGTADEYSDIDLWVDIEDEHENDAIEATENALNELAKFDYKYIMNHEHPLIRQRIYHLNRTSEYLMLDFCWQLHSRPKDSYAYYENDMIEAAKVIFDKDSIIRYKKLDLSEFVVANSTQLKEMQYRYTQHSRVIKYVRREQYLEAFAYYQRYVLEPLVFLLRITHTPAYVDYGYIHISQHIPKNKVEKLEYFAKASTLNDIERKTSEAEKWFCELVNEQVAAK